MTASLLTELPGALTATQVADIPVTTGHRVVSVTNLSIGGPQIFVRADGATAAVDGPGATAVAPGETVELHITRTAGPRPVVSLVSTGSQRYLLRFLNRFTTGAAQTRIPRRPAEDWTTEDPILADGQIGYDETSEQFRVGDGVHRWSDLLAVGDGGVNGLTIGDIHTVVDSALAGLRGQADGLAELGPNVRIPFAQLPDLTQTYVVTAAQVRAVVAAMVTAGTNVTVAYDINTGALTVAAPTDTEALQDTVAAMFQGGANTTVTYNDAAGTVTVAVTGLTETVQDIVGGVISGVDGVAVTYNDAANTVTVTVPDGALTTAKLAVNPLARANHTGTQSLSTITGTGTAAAANTTDFDPAGAASTAVAGHLAATDPHGDRAYADSVVNNLVDAAPGALDTLNALAAALGDDPNLATTLTNQIATKADDTAVVHNTTDETVDGVKTFTSAPVVPDHTWALPKVASITTARILGRITAGTGNIEELTTTQIKTLLALASSDVSGLGALATKSTIVNTDVASGAAIDLAKLAVNPLARANHTGTQDAATTLTGLGTAAFTASSAYDPSGAATSAVSGHVAATDPHGDRAYTNAHAASTTNVHGIVDTSLLILEGDARLSNTRTPSAHAITHTNGTDQIANATTSAAGLMSPADKTTVANLTENIQDTVGAMATAGTNTAITYDDTAGTLTVSAKNVPTVINVKDAPYNAVGDGSADDTTPIQSAINAAAPGQTVWVPKGIYRVTSQLDLKQGTVLTGELAARFAHYQTSDGSTTGPAIGTVLRMSSTFTGSAVLNATAAAAPSYTTGAVRVSHLVIDCRSNTTSTADGILCTGRLYDPRIENVTIQDPGGNGVRFVADGSGNKVLAAQLLSVMVHGAAGNGLDLYFADSYLQDCYALSCVGHGYAIRRMANTSMTGCRSEWNGQHGYLFTGEIAGGGTVTGCLTDRNGFDGVHIDGTSGAGSLVFTGCAFRRDGRNGGSGGGGYAAFRLQSCTQPVVLNGFTIQPGVDDDATGTNSPQYGIRSSGSRALTYSYGVVHAATTAIFDDGDNTTLQRGLGIVTATGTQGSPTYSYAQAANVPTGSTISLEGTSKLGLGKTPTIPLDATSATSGASQARWIYTGATGNTSPNVYVEGVEATGFGYGDRVNGDSIDRWRMEHSGKQWWGSGAATRDTALERSAAGVLKASNAFTVAGLTGATTASRYVGGTTTGSPTTGTFAVGDYVVAQDGKVWVCTTAGTPGTWFHAGAGSMSATNVKDYGAKGDNSTDDTAAIANAIAACPAGGIVFFPPGQYRTKNTIVVPPRVTLMGTVAPHWPIYEDDPQFSCCIKPYSGSFTGTALVKFLDKTDGGYSFDYSAGQRLTNITLSGVGATGPAGVAITGLYSAGPVVGVILEHVTIHNFTGHGIHTVNKNAAGGWPKGWQFNYVGTQFCDHGIYHEDVTSGTYAASTDMTYLNNWAGANDNDGWHVDSAISSDWVGCRSEFNSGNGYWMAGSSRARFIGCDSDRSVKDGFHFECQGNGSRKLELVGCVAARDGANDDITAGGYAGFNIVGTVGVAHEPVALVGCSVDVNHNDQSAGLWSPDYGLKVTYAPQVSVSACQFNGTVAPMLDSQSQVVYDSATRFNAVNGTTGVVTLEAANTHRISGTAGSDRALELWTSGSGRRWGLRASSAAEAGADAGSLFQLVRYSDAGAATTALTVNRATGDAVFEKDLWFQSTGRLTAGAGSPEGAVAGGVGVIYVQFDGTAGTCLWVKETATGNTGWVPISDSLNTATRPTDTGYKSWTYDPVAALNATAPTSGTVYLSRLHFRSLAAITKLCYGIVSITSASLTSGQCFVGLYDSTGNRVGVSSDISGGFSAAGELAFNLTGTVNVTPGFYWAALLMVGSTIPTFARGQGQITNFGSGQLTASTRRFGVAATSQTSLPTSFTPSSTTSVLQQAFWVAAA